MINTFIYNIHMSPIYNKSLTEKSVRLSFAMQYNFLSPKLRWIMVSCHLYSLQCSPYSITDSTSPEKKHLTRLLLEKESFYNYNNLEKPDWQLAY